MVETTGTEPVKAEEKPQPIAEKRERKEVSISSLTLNQRNLLKGGLKDSLMSDSAFNVLGSQQKVIFYDVCNMMANDKAIKMVDLTGEEYWKAVVTPNQKKREQQRFVKFRFDYVIPGTSNKLSVVKEWRYEDFAQ